jgi:hypothetical protein
MIDVDAIRRLTGAFGYTGGYITRSLMVQDAISGAAGLAAAGYELIMYGVEAQAGPIG